ncbi:MAG: hypothetical protein AB7T63_03955 [Planctomycetota bacterium]
MSRHLIFAFIALFAACALGADAVAQPEDDSPPPAGVEPGNDPGLQDPGAPESDPLDLPAEASPPAAPESDPLDLPSEASYPAAPDEAGAVETEPLTADGPCGVPAHVGPTNAMEPASAMGPVNDMLCRQYLPCRCEVQSQVVEIPACLGTRRVPQYEEVEVPCMAVRRVPQVQTVEIPVWKTRNVPVMTTRRVPRYENVEVPCYATRQVPQYESVEIPVWKTREVPILVNRSVPQTRMVCDECTGEMELVVCGYTTEQVPCGTRTERYQDGVRTEQRLVGYRAERYQNGTRTERRLAGYDTEQVQCGVRTERYQDGVRTEQRICGYTSEVYQDGTRTERRLVGYDTESYVIRPATTRVVTRRVVLPAQWVTVAPDGQAELAEPKQGTTQVMSQSEYARAARLALR